MKLCFWNSETGQQDERDMTPDEEAQHLASLVPSKDQFNAPILAALAAIDARTIRPLREGDTARVAALEAEATSLRAKLIK